MLDPHAEGMPNGGEASQPRLARVALLRAAARGRSMLRPYTSTPPPSSANLSQNANL